MCCKSKIYPFVGTCTFILWVVVANWTSVGAISVSEVVSGLTLTVEANAVNNPIEKRAMKVIFKVFISFVLLLIVF